MTDRKVVVEEEIFDRQEAARYLKLGTAKFDELYGGCADYQGGKTVTYKKSKLLDRYDQVCESSREVSA